MSDGQYQYRRDAPRVLTGEALSQLVGAWLSAVTIGNRARAEETWALLATDASYRDDPDGFLRMISALRDLPRPPSLRSRGLGAAPLAKTQPRSIVLPAGSSALAVLRVVFGRRATERIFAQVVADMRDEWLEAEAAGRPLLSRWIAVRGHVALLAAVVAFVGVWVTKLVSTIWRLGR